MVWNQVASHYNPTYLNVSLVSFLNSKGENLLNFSMTSNVTIQKYMATFTFSLPKSQNDKEYENQILHSTINMCKLDDGVRGNFLAKMLMEDFYNSADFDLKCPFEPRTNLICSTLKYRKITFRHIFSSAILSS